MGVQGGRGRSPRINKVKNIAAAIVLVSIVCGNVSARQATILQIKVTVVDTDQRERAIPRHALLISDNPATAAPRRVLTGLDGTAQVPLRPGNYTVESDEPLIFQGKSYEWTQTLDVPAGRVTTLNLTAANAEVAAATGADTQSAAAVEASASTVIVAWQNSVVSIWTPTRHWAGSLRPTHRHQPHRLAPVDVESFDERNALMTQIRFHFEVRIE